jgi:cellulose biosynthesis protein BcsQ
MKIVSVINYKGGVGKTSLTANLGAELAWRGKRVLLLDLDAQASLTFPSFAQTNGVGISKNRKRLNPGLIHSRLERQSHWLL